VEYPSKRELDKLALELAAAEAAEAADSDDETDLNPAAARRHISRANTFAGKLKDMKKIQAAYRSHLQQPTVYVQGSDIHQQVQPMELGASYGQLRDFLRQPSWEGERYRQGSYTNPPTSYTSNQMRYLQKIYTEKDRLSGDSELYLKTYGGEGQRNITEAARAAGLWGDDLAGYQNRSRQKEMTREEAQDEVRNHLLRETLIGWTNYVGGCIRKIQSINIQYTILANAFGRSYRFHCFHLLNFD